MSPLSNYVALILTGQNKQCEDRHAEYNSHSGLVVAISASRYG